MSPARGAHSDSRVRVRAPMLPGVANAGSQQLPSGLVGFVLTRPQSESAHWDGGREFAGASTSALLRIHPQLPGQVRSCTTLGPCCRLETSVPLRDRRPTKVAWDPLALFPAPFRGSWTAAVCRPPETRLLEVGRAPKRRCPASSSSTRRALWLATTGPHPEQSPPGLG